MKKARDFESWRQRLRFNEELLQKTALEKEVGSIRLRPSLNNAWRGKSELMRKHAGQHREANAHRHARIVKEFILVGKETNATD